jgi:3-oxoacyl-[acyl-carrier-protein] synthase-1
MTAPAIWTGRLAITGLGVVTPVGLSTSASVAALRARISSIGDLPWYEIPSASGELKPITGAQVPIVPGNRQGPARLVRLAEHALKEVLTGDDLKPPLRCGLFIGTAVPQPAGRILAQGELIRQALGETAAAVLRIESAVLFESGRAAGLHAIRMAVQELTKDDSPLDIAIAGGVDSLVSPRTLNFLQAAGRLRDGEKSTGILPGEGAGFLVLEKPENARRRGASILATIEAAAGAVEATPFGKPTRAVALGHVLRAVAAKVADPLPLILSDLNGERQWAYEWMFAGCRAPYYHGGMPHWRLSESIGDAGAASGAVASAWAVDALRRGYARSSQAVVWGASDEGLREAIVFKTPMD